MVLTISLFVYTMCWLNYVLQGTFCIASWRGIQVAVKKLGEEFFVDEEKVWVVYMWQINISVVDSTSSFFVLVISDSVYFYAWVLFSVQRSGMSLLYFRKYGTQMLSNFLVL